MGRYSSLLLLCARWALVRRWCLIGDVLLWEQKGSSEGGLRTRSRLFLAEFPRGCSGIGDGCSCLRCDLGPAPGCDDDPVDDPVDNDGCDDGCDDIVDAGGEAPGGSWYMRSGGGWRVEAIVKTAATVKTKPQTVMISLLTRRERLVHAIDGGGCGGCGGGGGEAGGDGLVACATRRTEK